MSSLNSWKVEVESVNLVGGELESPEKTPPTSGQSTGRLLGYCMEQWNIPLLQVVPW